MGAGAPSACGSVIAHGTGEFDEHRDDPVQSARAWWSTTMACRLCSLHYVDALHMYPSVVNAALLSG